MVFDQDRSLLNAISADFDYAFYNDFDSYCFTASMLIKRGLFIKARIALSKASALIEKILRAKHPRALACFLKVLIHLTQTGLPKVAYISRGHLKRISIEVIKKGDP